MVRNLELLQLGQDLVAKFEVIGGDSVYAKVECLISGGEELDRMMTFHGLDKLEDAEKRKVQIKIRQEMEQEIEKIIAENMPVQNPH